MSVGLLLITHRAIGEALLGAACGMFNGCPLRVQTMEITEQTDRDLAQAAAWDLVARLDQGDGILVLTDLYGSTPANVAFALSQRPNVRVLTGLNLPMLVRVLNYPSLGLADLTEKALSGGREGVQPAPSMNQEAGP